MRKNIVRWILKNSHFGDLWEWQSKNEYRVSCVFVFYGRIDLLRCILSCLDNQELDKDDVEIILVEDKGGTEAGKALEEEFSGLNISHFAPDVGWSQMGYMRNFGLSKAKGEIVLFLDDDTVILDRLFLRRLLDLFETDGDLAAVMPMGKASYCLIKHRYCYHDPFFLTNRCVAYRRSVLIEEKGFKNCFIGQEDVEFAARFFSKGYKYKKEEGLIYFHPPLLVSNLKKPASVGYSFAISGYPFYVKVLFAMNGIRWLPLVVWPTVKNRNKSKFSLGFALGFLKGLVKSSVVAYE